MVDVELQPRKFLVYWMIAGVAVYPLAGLLLAAVWGTISVVGSSLTNRYGGLRPESFLSVALIVIASGAVIGLCVGVLQRALLRRYLCWTAERWQLYSIIGGTLGAMAAAVVFGGLSVWMERQDMASNRAYDLASMSVMPVFIGIVALVQYFSLRRAVRQASLWILANVVGGLIFSGMIGVNAPRLTADVAWLVVLLGVLAQAFVTGVTMLWLFEQRGYPVQPDKNEMAYAYVPVESQSQARPGSVWDDAI